MAKIEHSITLSDDTMLQVADAMQRLVRYPEWQTYCEVLRTARVEAREAAVDSAPAEELPTWRGVVLGYKFAEALPETIIGSAKQIAERRAKEREAEGRMADVLPFAKGSMFEGDDSGPTF